MDEETKIIARACEARVLGVWALHLFDYERYAVTHVPSGCAVGAWSHYAAELVWRALAEKLPRFAEDATFGGPLGKVKISAVTKLAEATVRGLRMKEEPAEPET